MGMTRRNLLKAAAVGGSALLLDGWARGAPAQMMGGGSSPAVSPFRVPLPLPPVLSPTFTDATADHYTVRMIERRVEILPGTSTTIWGYEGAFPGPTIEARSGRKVVVTWANDLPEEMVVHLHGGHTPAASDGHPTDYVAPGSDRTCVYPNRQPAAMLWYHDHAMDRTGPHVFKGLAGLYILRDDREDLLPLPKGRNEIPLLIQDRSFHRDGSLNYAPGSNMMDSAFLGDTILSNGAVQPYLQVGTTKIRLRVLNGSNARPYRLALGNGQGFTQIGSDGGLLPRPVERTSITLHPGERTDLIVDFSRSAIGTQVLLRNSLSSGRTGSILRFDVVRRETDHASVPALLAPYKALLSSSATSTREFLLSPARGGRWTINGRSFDPSITSCRPQRGSTEIWRFVNRSGMVHPIHLHDVQFQVLDVNGAPVTAASTYYGWKDTVQVPAMGELRLIAKFTDYRGLYVFHCHILEHEDRGMMGQFEVI